MIISFDPEKIFDKNLLMIKSLIKLRLKELSKCNNEYSPPKNCNEHHE